MLHLRSRFGLSFGCLVGFGGLLTSVACGSGFDTAPAGPADASTLGAGDVETMANDAARTGDGDDDAEDATTLAPDGGADDGGSGDAGPAQDAADGAGTDGGPCIDDCQSAEYLALAGGSVDFLAVSSLYVVWVETGPAVTLARDCTFDTAEYQDAGSSGIAVTNVRDLAVNASAAFIAYPGANNTNLTAFGFDGTVTARGDSNKPVNAVTTLGTAVYDVANGFLETNDAQLDAGTQLSNAPILGNQIKAAGNWIYYTDDNNILYACSPGSDNCSLKYQLFKGPASFVYAVNDNQNVFWFDQQGSVLGCTFDKSQPSPGYGCTTAQTIARVTTPTAIATVADDVYWIDNGASPPAVYSVHTPQSHAGSIGAPFAGRRRVAPADHNDTLGKLAVNSTYVVWAEQESPTLSILVRAGLSVP